ncbi:amidase family protein [Curtobacterium sp. MCPF17_050]|uniref:amidase family protein n=1 Tax=Curtobacterium sp. MCPF17_050 TaxID=2175664 RepID=UPI000D87EE65|nr:amidase family protein [Curtobacterium sp. MCPF17_050]WIB16303.1 amidase family protein [Curtobacterium sp. MCPF17_050]
MTATDRSRTTDATSTRTPGGTPVTRRRRTTVAGAALLALVGTAVVATPSLVASAAPAAVDASPAAMLAPYYTALDLTGDDQVTQTDLTVLSDHLGTSATDPDWSTVSVADVDSDGTITLTDVAGLSQRIIYDDGPFRLVEASTLDMQAAMNAGVTTSAEITQDYLDRIAAYDRTTTDTGTGGRPLNSIVTTNAAALTAAKAADAERAAHGMTSMLLGVPIALKDNYDTKDMPTTGGCGCWDDNQTTTDAAMVAGLRDAGAVVLAKASLDEFAFGFVSEFSSNQPAGSSLLVASPYVTSQTAGGSSGGTGAAIAANLAGIGFGTDTGGSIRVPSSYNQLVGIRPTVGLASRDGIIPLALSQDTGGPLARSVTDAAVALDAVTGIDAADPVTQGQAGKVPTSYTQFLDPTALQGKRIGYVTSMVGTNRTTARLFAEARATLEAQGATVVPITATPEFNRVLSEGSGSTNEFKHDLDQYVAKHLDPDVTARSLQGILDSGEYVPSRKGTYQQRNAITEAQYQAWAGPEGSHTTQIATGKQVVTGMMDAQDLDALVYPSGTPYGTQGTNMRLSPNTGMPAVTVPMGQATAADATITGAGVNLEFLGRSYDEGTVIGLGYGFEQATHARTTPALYPALG